MARRAYFAPLALILGAAGTAWLWPQRPLTLTSPLSAAEAPPRGDGQGYTTALEIELKKIGQITPDDFARRYPLKTPYLPKLSWDPVTAKFFDQVMMDPAAADAEVRLRGMEERIFGPVRKWEAEREGRQAMKDGRIMKPAKGLYDFRLKGDELTLYKKNGFVVSERMGAKSCTDMYYRIYVRDLPVFISSDSILHAWHLSYDAMLEEIEGHVLHPWLGEILQAMREQLPQAKREYGETFMRDALVDADFFLTMACSLLAGQVCDGELAPKARIAQTYQACMDLAPQYSFQLFSDKRRRMDFSQFKPRGHYERTETLQRYFRAMMWLGRIDLRVAGNPEESSPLELGAAMVLHDLLQRSGKLERWQAFDRVLTGFVGKPDSMTFGQLGAILKAARIQSPTDVKDLDALTALQTRILQSKFGEQEIRGDWFCMDPHDPKKFILPRSFTFLGQRFVPDSWALAKLVFDDILWDNKKVMRRVPSCLDVGFAVFGNDSLVPALTERMATPEPVGRKFRDGLNYQHNLAAVRNVLDAKPGKTWEDNLYTGWLGALRELSKPTSDPQYPEAMRTQAWAMKTVNTQMASWTQLRHDTVLYAKQSYTGGVSCFYPAGYVEPVPHFWNVLEQMALRAARTAEELRLPHQGDVNPYAAFFQEFAKTAGTLKSIAEKELAQKDLSKEETKFLEDVVEIDRGCGGPPSYFGWYPRLLYGAWGEKANKWDALVADVHSNTPALPFGDPGCILHQAVGNIDCLIIAIDNGKDRMTYVGPVLSHYEFEQPWGSRKTDSEWRNDLRTGKTPPRPAWTHGYLAPGVNPEAAKYDAEEGQPRGGK